MLDIAVVAPGQTIWTLANAYGVTAEQIAALNGLADPSRLTPGQALVVPAAGSRPRASIETNAYLQPSNPERDRRLVAETEQSLTYYSVFEYKVRADGSLEAPDDEVALQAISETAAVPMMVVANFEEGNFSPAITRAIFSDPAIRQRTIDGIAQTMADKGYRAINIDFENLYPDDRDAYSDFLRDLTERLHGEGYIVSSALAPKTSAEQVGSWYEGHDYRAHGEIVDFVIIMTYEWGWSGGPPMAVAPLPQVRQVLEYALSEIPAHKIMMGAPLYGYDWTLPFIPGGKWARVVSPQAAVEQAVRVGAYIRYDEVAQAPYYHYYDENGAEHVVWFEDARSMQAKFDLLKSLGLRGISYWVLGNPFPQNWALLPDNFDIQVI